MKLITPEQMRAIDRKAIEIIGIPGIVLMENAAFHVSLKADKILEGNKGSRVLVLAGNGNNGGDAFAVTRHLLSMGYMVSLYTLCPIGGLKGDAAVNASILDKMGFETVLLDGEESIERLARSCSESDLVIDGLFGTGLNRDVTGWAEKAIGIINGLSECTLSIDIPSGVDGLTGRICGTAIKADYTVTFFLPKAGMAQYPGAAHMGELTVADIGIPYALADGLETVELTGPSIVSGILPRRPEDAHKGTFGKVTIIAGSYGMPGAAYLSALSAYSTGTGLVRLAVPHELVPVLAGLVPEAVFTPLNAIEGHIAKIDDSVLESLLDSSDAVLIGPGLSCNPDTLELVRQVASLCRKPLAIDADALNLISADKDILRLLKCDAVVTPHPAEMSRLTGIGTREIQENRIETARKFAREYGLTVVLKGAGTVISDPLGNVSINPTGNNGMATAGSGDVLAGMIISLMGQGIPASGAAVAGAYLHGLAGDKAAMVTGQESLMASDIAEMIGSAIQSVNGKDIT